MFWLWLIFDAAMEASVSPPASQPRPAVTREYRFDALRIDGALRGPDVLVIQTAARQATKPLGRLAYSFVPRIFETVEESALHGDR
jgi:hypothetical protein